MGFRTEECRNEYFLEYRYRLVMAMEAREQEDQEQGARKALVAEGEAALSYRRIFFICAEVSRSLRLSLKQPYLLVASKVPALVKFLCDLL
jgi:hypothetical protein